MTSHYALADPLTLSKLEQVRRLMARHARRLFRADLLDTTCWTRVRLGI